MSKDTFYFSHDYNARSDEKIVKLLSKKGMEGYGIYWSIIEMLYENANAMLTQYESIAYALHSDKDKIKSVVEDFDLFEVENGIFGSLSVNRRLIERAEKSDKAREAAHKRWNKQDVDANALQSECDSNASKGKERKVKERKDTSEDEVVAFYHSICKSYPKVKRLTPMRKAYIQARLINNSLEEILEVFEIAEKSKWLKSKNWTDFDWIMSDTEHFTSILEGKYNKKHQEEPDYSPGERRGN